MANKRKRAAKEFAASSQPTAKKSKKSLDSNAVNPSKSVSSRDTGTLDKSPFLDNPTGEQRRREAFLYELLGSEDSADRINAADAIVSGLLAGDGAPPSVLQRHLDKRLFRGLASGRNASRLGFSLVITEILRQLFGEEDLANSRYPGLSFNRVLTLLVERTQPTGNIPGQEERDYYFGQLFGIECFANSGVLFSDKTRWLAVLDLLLKLASKKVWMRAQCGWIIVQAVQRMGQKLAEKTVQRLSDEGLSKTPEGVAIWIVAIDRFPGMKVPSKPWRDPLSPKALAELPLALKDSGKEASNPQDAGGRKQKQSNWTAQLHFVWDVILAHYAKPVGRNSSDAAESFKLFWNRVVDESFFSKSASDSQKFSGFMIFQKAVESSPSAPFIVDAVFSKNLMACLVNQAAKEDRYLHRAALKALKGVETTVHTKPSILEPVLRQLLGPNGSYTFDQRTSTKTVEKLLQSTTAANINAILDVIKPVDESEPSSALQAYANYLFKIASIPPETEETTKSDQVPPAAVALQELAKIAYSREAAASPPDKSRNILRSRLSSAFAKFVKRPEDFPHLCNAVLLIEADVGMDEEIESALVQALERLKDLLDPQGISADLKAPYQALALLHAVGILQLYNEDPDAVETLGDLEQCYEKLKGDGREARGGISEFLVDILLSMVAQPSSLMRQASQQVFEAFTPTLSSEAIELLTDPLATNENTKGQQALFSTEEEDLNAADGGGSEDGDDDDDNSSLDSDVEIVDLEDAPSDDGSDANNASDGDSDSDDGVDVENENENEPGDNDGESAALDTALAEVLKSHRLDKDDGAGSSDDSDMTDSEMMELDEKLVEIFKQRAKSTNKKKENKDAKESVANFKHRILDLLGIFVRKEAATTNPLVFQTLVPLLQLMRATSTKSLANKACEIILALGKGLKKSRGQQEAEQIRETDPEALFGSLRDIHEEASKDPSHLFARAASAASTAVASVVCADAKMQEQVFQLYSQTQLRWYRGEVRMQASFFADWLNWCQSHASNMIAQSKGKGEVQT